MKTKQAKEIGADLDGTWLVVGVIGIYLCLALSIWASYRKNKAIAGGIQHTILCELKSFALNNTTERN